MLKINPILNTLWRICLLKLGPQNLPASTFLLSGTMVLAFLMSTFLNGFGAAVIEVLSLTILTGGLLLFFGYNERFEQTLTAIMGAGLIIGSIVAFTFTILSNPPNLIRFTIFFWNLSILANILRHSLNVSGFHAGLLSLVYAFLINRVIATVEGNIEPSIS